MIKFNKSSVFFSLIIISGLSYILLEILINQNIIHINNFGPGLGGDLQRYINSSSAFLNGQDPYDNDFKYFPITIFFFIPFALIGYKLSFIAMLLLNILLIGLTAYFIVRILKHYSVNLSMPKIFLFLLLFFPVSFCLVLGQIGNILTMCLLVIFYYFIITNKSTGSVFTLVFATLFKIFPIAFIMHYIFNKNYKSLALYTFALLSIVLVSVLFLGIPIHYSYIETFVDYQGQGSISNSNLSPALTPLFNYFVHLTGVKDYDLANIVWLAIRALFLIALAIYCWNFFKINRKETGILLFSLISVLVMALPAYSQHYFSAILVLPFILMFYALNLNKIEKYVLCISMLLYAYCLVIVYFIAINFGGLKYFIMSTGAPAFATFLFLAVVLFEIYKQKQIVMSGKQTVKK